MTYRCILADPPWQQPLSGQYRAPKNKRPGRLPYPTLTVARVAAMPVGQLAADRCHLWLWTSNAFLRDGFKVMDAWGFRYLAPIHWVKPSGLGNYFVHRTQTLLFGYKGRCHFPQARYRPNVLFAPALRHSQKPECSYELIEAVSPGPRLELFARRTRPGWHVWGDEVAPDVRLEVAA